MENFPQLLQLVSNLVRLYHHIHYLPNQKETQIDLLLKDNDASLSFQKRIDIYSACQWEQKFPRKHRVDEGFIYNFVTFMSDAMYIERKRNPDMWSGMEMLFNGGNSDKLKYIIMFTNRNKEKAVMCWRSILKDLLTRMLKICLDCLEKLRLEQQRKNLD